MSSTMRSISSLVAARIDPPALDALPSHLRHLTG
jgi:hypothetical protein